MSREMSSRIFDDWFLFAGYGVFATKKWPMNSFLAEYRGELLDYAEGLRREKLYEKKGEGCFLFEIKHKGRRCWSVSFYFTSKQ